MVTETTSRPVKKIRHIRMPDPLWHAAAAKAEENGETISEVIRRLLHEYVDQD